MNKINLLPPEFKKEIEQAKKNSKTLNATLKTAAFILIVLAIYLAGLWQFTNLLNAETRAYNDNQEKIETYGNLEEKSKKISERLNTIRSIDRNSPKWSGVIEEIQKIMPSGIYLTKVKMDNLSKTRNKISGYARSKQEVAALRDLMDKSEKFEYVDIESTSTVKDPNTKKDAESFNISFSLSKEALK